MKKTINPIPSPRGSCSIKDDCYLDYVVTPISIAQSIDQYTEDEQ